MHPYSTEAYADSLAHWGRAVRVPEWGCSVIARPVVDDLEDVAGTYPLGVIDQNANIRAGIDRLREQCFVSIVVTVDDFNRPSLDRLSQAFDSVSPFKTNFVYRPARGLRYGEHHAYQIRRALRVVRVGPIDLQLENVAWRKLYANLVRRRRLHGLHAFPDSYHEALSRLAGVTAIGAWVEGELVSCSVWIRYGDHVNSHLGASAEEGYAIGAAYAVYDASLRYFADAKVVNLGGGAGLTDSWRSGLGQFKRGFANGTAQSYMCRTVLSRAIYDALVHRLGRRVESAFFPAYRSLE